MNRRNLLAIAAISLLLGGTAFAYPAHKCSHAAKTPMAMHGQGGHHAVQKIIASVSKAGLDSTQAKQVSEAINTFKQTKMQIMASKTMPLDAFKDDAFDKAQFVQTMSAPKMAMVEAKAELIASVYAVLNAEQKKVFKRECTAGMVEKMIRKDMMKGHGHKKPMMVESTGKSAKQ